MVFHSSMVDENDDDSMVLAYFFEIDDKGEQINERVKRITNGTMFAWIVELLNQNPNENTNENTNQLKAKGKAIVEDKTLAKLPNIANLPSTILCVGFFLLSFFFFLLFLFVFFSLCFVLFF